MPPLRPRRGRFPHHFSIEFFEKGPSPHHWKFNENCLPLPLTKIWLRNPQPRRWKQSKNGKKQEEFLLPNSYKKRRQNASRWYEQLLGRFRRYWCSSLTLFNYYSNLSIRGTFLIKSLPPLDNRGLLPNPKETYELNLSAITSGIWVFRTPT